MDSDGTNNVVEIFDKYAQMYEDKYMSVEKYHLSLEKFCDCLSNENASVLELACGPGNITKFLLNKIPTLNILATDLSSIMLKLAQKNNPNADFKVLDCRSILNLKSKFDAIVCGFGLPYLSKEDATQMIIDASKSIHVGGLIYLSTMEDDYSKSGFTRSSTNPNDGMYMYYHQADYLVDTLEQYGFEMIDLSRVKYIDDKNENVVDLLLIGKLTMIK
jgi:predicted TPR repeat methyltransferase